MSEAAQRSERVPDFIPGWFKPRSENPDPAMREAVRIPEVGDHFPITFLRSNERVSPAKRPQLGFTIGTTAQPGHARFDLAVPPGYWIARDSDGHLHNWTDEAFKAKYTRSDRDWTPPVEREMPSGRPAAAERRRCGAEEPKALRDNPHLSAEQRAEFEDQLRYAEGWKGTPPAEGTRRWVIAKAVREHYDRTGEYVDTDRPALARDVADAVESALLQATIHEEATARYAEAVTAGIVAVDPITPRATAAPHANSIEEFCGGQRQSHRRLRTVDPGFAEYHRGAELAYDIVLGWLERNPNRTIKPSPIHDQLDRVAIPRYAPGEGPQRILTLAERVEHLIRRYRAQEFATDGIADLAVAQAERLGRAEGQVPRGTRELRIVLDDVSPADQPPEYRFVELEDQDGRGIGAFKMRPTPDGKLLEVVIPYARDDAWVSEVAHQAGGAVSGVFLREDGEKVMPAEECAAAVSTILTSFGVKAPGDHAAEEQLEHGQHETSGQVWPKGSPEHRRVMAGAGKAPEEGIKDKDELIKFLEGEVERFLSGREEARSGESRYAEERDCAFALLRWLLPVTVAKRLED